MKVKFIPQNKEVEIKPGQSVLNVAQDHEIHIQSVCKGIPSCAECRVQVVEGEENVLPPMDNELDLIGTAYFVDRRRLSCQMRCFGNVTVDLSEQIEKEQESSKQPQGRASKKEGEESFARMGNILDENSGPSKSESDESNETDESNEPRKPIKQNKQNNRNKRRRRNKPNQKNEKS